VIPWMEIWSADGLPPLCGLARLASCGGIHRAGAWSEVRLSPEQSSASRLRKKRRQAVRTPNRAATTLRAFSLIGID